MQGTPSPSWLTALTRRARAVAVLITACCVAAVASTYPRVGVTGDEPAHLAAGMELLDHGRYTYDVVAPPLARLAVAAVPYAVGLRSAPDTRRYAPGQRIIADTAMYGAGYRTLQSTPDFRRNVAYARSGVLVFLVLACAATFLLAERVVGRVWALGALALFAATPPVLAHSGVATTDTALTAMFGLTVLALLAYLGRPSATRAGAVGVAAGLAVASKLTALPFLAVAGGAVLAARAAAARRLGWPRVRGSHVVLAPVLALVVLWASYGFSTAQLTTPEQRPHSLVTRFAPDAGPKQDALNALLEARLPAPEFFDGLRYMMTWNKAGMPSFLLGEKRRTGWWYFFPVAVAVKTPLPLLLAAAAGLVAAFRARAVAVDGEDDAWTRHAIAAVPVALVASVMPTQINIGVRHVLPIYPFLAVLGALGLRWACTALAARRQTAAAVAVSAVALGAQLVVAARSQPDHLCYFNPLAGREPEQVLVYSDCGWNQDYQQLADTLRARGIDRVTLASNLPITRSVLQSMGFPRVDSLRAATPVGGWVALDVFHWTMGSVFDDRVRPADFAWVQPYPYVRVGKTIRLYHVTPTPAVVGAPAR